MEERYKDGWILEEQDGEITSVSIPLKGIQLKVGQTVKLKREKYNLEAGTEVQIVEIVEPNVEKRGRNAIFVECEGDGRYYPMCPGDFSYQRYQSLL